MLVYTDSPTSVYILLCGSQTWNVIFYADYLLCFFYTYSCMYEVMNLYIHI